MSHPFDRIIRRGKKSPAAPKASATNGGAPTRVAGAPTATGAGESGIDPAEERELRAKRDRLIEKFTVMQCDLGGAFYEMAIRDHVRMDVLTKKAAELQGVDAELLAIERILEIERSDAAGMCPTCGTPFTHGTMFCSQCGSPLSQPVAQ